MTYATAYIETEIDVDLSRFEIEDLIAEVESRGELTTPLKLQISNLYDAKRLSDFNPLVRFEEKLDQFFRETLGKGL